HRPESGRRAWPVHRLAGLLHLLRSRAASPGLAPGGLPPGPAGRVLVADPRHGSGGGVRAVPDTRAGTAGAPERLADTVAPGAHGWDPAPPARRPGPHALARAHLGARLRAAPGDG